VINFVFDIFASNNDNNNILSTKLFYIRFCEKLLRLIEDQHSLEFGVSHEFHRNIEKQKFLYRFVCKFVECSSVSSLSTTRTNDMCIV
jgi:hypothetical protein